MLDKLTRSELLKELEYHEKHIQQIKKILANSKWTAKKWKKLSLRFFHFL